VDVVAYGQRTLLSIDFLLSGGFRLVFER